MATPDFLSSPFQVNNLKLLDKSKLKATKLPDDMMVSFKQALDIQHKVPINLKDHVSQKAYAEVKVGGTTVAKIFNSGCSETSNSTYARVKNLPSMGEDCTLSGPELAQLRAEEIAKALGGTVVKSSTAVTQSEYLAAPPIEYQTVSADSIDSSEHLQKRSTSARALFAVQLEAQRRLA